MDDVLVAARKRVALVFDKFERVSVSVSGGKDSQVLWHLCAEEASRRGLRVEAMFLDQEAEYAGSIEVIESIMSDPRTDARWYQIPLRMTNATSHAQPWLNGWEEGEKWMRDKSPLAIHEVPGAPTRFYDFMPWYEKQAGVPTAFLIGLRSRESLNRWRAAKRKPGYMGIGWSTVAAKRDCYRFYPLFDWGSGDVWKYLLDEGLRYNRVYDRMFMLGMPEKSLRVSFLLHEQSYRSMKTLQEIEPETFDAVVKRVGGAHYASIYADEAVLSAKKLPSCFSTWKEFRDYLVRTTPLEYMGKLEKRFASQGDDDASCHEHVRQLLINDWENNTPIRRTPAEKLRQLWWDRL